MICGGNGEDHCCYVNGLCRYLEEYTMADRRWSCALRRTLGSWHEVHKDAGYKKYIQPMWNDRGGGSCGDWPTKGELCAACEKIG